jgi:hypothetical protein
LPSSCSERQSQGMGCPGSKERMDGHLGNQMILTQSDVHSL